MRAFGHATRLPFAPGGEEHGAHGCRLAAADRHDVALDGVHAVVDGKAARNHATRAVDEEHDVFVVQGIQVQELLHDAFGALVIDTAPQKDAALGGEEFFRLLHHFRSLVFFLFVAIGHSKSFLFGYNLEISFYYRLARPYCQTVFAHFDEFLYLSHASELRQNT